MGTSFDYRDVLSHPDNRDITKEQFENRMMLRSLMIKYGFMPIRTEWWHFTLKTNLIKIPILIFLLNNKLIRLESFITKDILVFYSKILLAIFYSHKLTNIYFR